MISSRGHIKDLPKSRIGVDVDNNFNPTYIKIRGKAKIIQSIKKACAKASVIYLAPDPDREGEAIAQHLAEELDSHGSTIKRALFYEITPEHVRDALNNSTEINGNLVNAHKARRVLDRLVGYYTSPILWAIIKRGLSAGRVQSVALRLICERENEIATFVSTPYWTAEAEFTTRENENFKANLWQIDKTNRRINSEKELNDIKQILSKGVEFTITSFKINNPQRTPPPPLITSTLQQEASKKFHFSAKKTMVIAQQLYEGVDLPQGRMGLISYMRTDSVRVNENTLNELRDQIIGKFGKEYLAPNIRIFKDRKHVQSGHEAIHPTKIMIEPDLVKGSLTPDQYRIYKLIYDRFFASQMANAKYRQKEAIVSHQNIDFRSEESKPVFHGYQIVSGDIIERGNVPDLTQGEIVVINNIEFIEKKTEPSPRYTEASLIKKMEENGVGRPSTYAHIMDTLFNRYYIKKIDNKIQASELGMQVYNILIPRFDDIFEVSFTADMEKSLDQIETGKTAWTDILHKFYEPFIAKLNAAKEEV
ncbi:DNA topoisomerase I, partial [candidate division WOR-3 bacterium RBG_13_43_14]